MIDVDNVNSSNPMEQHMIDFIFKTKEYFKDKYEDRYYVNKDIIKFLIKEGDIDFNNEFKLLTNIENIDILKEDYNRYILNLKYVEPADATSYIDKNIDKIFNLILITNYSNTGYSYCRFVTTILNILGITSGFESIMKIVNNLFYKDLNNKSKLSDLKTEIIQALYDINTLIIKRKSFISNKKHMHTNCWFIDDITKIYNIFFRVLSSYREFSM